MKISETPTPLWLLAFFFSFAEIALGFAVTQTTEGVKTTLVVFCVLFPILIVVAFLLMLWRRPYVFYPPRDFGVPTDVASFVNAMRGEKTEKRPEEKPGPLAESGNTPDLLASEQPSEEIALVTTNASGHSESESRVWDLLEKGEYETGLETLKASVRLAEPERIAIYQFFAFEKGHQRALDDLRLTARAFHTAPEVSIWLAMALGRIGEAKAAVAEFQRALDLSSDEAQRAMITRLLARELSSSGKRETAIDVLEAEIRRLSNIQAKSTMYVVCAEIYAEAAPPDLVRSFAMYELALLYDPANEDLLFKVAYAYDQQGVPGMSFLHYKNLISRNPGRSMALNNLGWEAHQLGLSATSVEFYERAKDLGVPLAFSNLANKLLSVGFIKAAKELLSESQGLGQELDTRITRTIGDVARIEEEEAQKQSEILRKATRMQAWRRRHAQALVDILPDRVGFEGTYSNGEWTLELRLIHETSIEGSLRRVYGAEPLQIQGMIRGRAVEFLWQQKSTATSNLFQYGP